MAGRDELIAFLDELLDAERFDDYCPNGLQVPGGEEVEVVVTGVSAHRELFERAAEAGAQMVLCHHGLFWEGTTRRVTPAMRERLRILFDGDMSLVAYHLPLDAHPEVGNNALLCRLLGFAPAGRFAEHRGRAIGLVGRSDGGVPLASLVDRCRGELRREPLVLGAGPDPVRSAGIVTGGAASDLSGAIELGLDAFITGEPSEPAMAEAREAGVHFVAAGHHATETLGVRRLGELLSERFRVRHEFVDVPNPV